MAIDFDKLVLKPCNDSFGDPVTYIPRMYARFTTSGIFDRAYTAETIKEGMVVTETMPVLGIRDSDFPNAPMQGDKLIVKGEVFEVREPRPDGHGATKLMLNFVTDYTNI